MPIPRPSSATARRAFRAREAEVVGALLEEADGGAIALGGGSVLSRADPRGAGPPHRRLAAGRRRARPGGGSPTPTGRWRATPRTSNACSPTRLPLYEELADAVVPMGDRGDRPPRPAGDPRRCRTCRPGRKLLWATSASRRVPGRWSAAACSSCGWWPLEGRRFCVTDRAVGAALRASASAPLAGRRRGRAGGGGEDAGRGRARAARAGPRGDDPRGPRGRPRRRRRRRPRRALRPPLPARRAGRPGADHARRPGRLRLRRQDRRRPAGGQELRRRLPAARRGDRRHRDPGDAARRPSSPPASSRC